MEPLLLPTRVKPESGRRELPKDFASWPTVYWYGPQEVLHHRDTIGLLLAVHVIAASIQNRDSTKLSLMAEEDAADVDEQIVYMFLADTATMNDPAHPLLAVDLWDEPGRKAGVSFARSAKDLKGAAHEGPQARSARGPKRGSSVGRGSRSVQVERSGT
ncbi:DUF6924 domain-containing protein [Streptomyces sp. NPDC101118]|uniref:DUF6924 domain-containing protein n=1 Tax=Streptomyces sp. NPDC101118 TaxID=3366109 RepID=UPI00382FF61B